MFMHRLQTGQPVVVLVIWVVFVVDGRTKNTTKSGLRECLSWSRKRHYHVRLQGKINAEQKENELRNKGIVVQAATKNILSEEAPEAYKNVDQVIENTSVQT